MFSDFLLVNVYVPYPYDPVLGFKDALNGLVNSGDDRDSEISIFPKIP
jgi:hypothetical protein